MTRCVGLPSGPCPDKRNDNTVRLGTGDLMLCKNCDQKRFKMWLESQKKQPSASSVSAGNEDSTIKSNKSAKGKGKGKNPQRTVRVTDVTESDADADIQCTGCLWGIAEGERVACAICADTFHVSCIGLPEKLHKQFLGLLEYVGWVCENCRSTLRSKAQKLQAEVSTLSENIAQLHSDVAELKVAQQQLVKPSTVPPTTSAEQVSDSVAWPPGRAANDTDVLRVLNDINKRKSNVIVSGLVEDESVDDTVAFQQLCEDYLECKPLVVSCLRLGQRTQDKPRRLLVRLREERTALSLLQSSRRLRSASDDVVRTVYINKDLTPAEAKLAFEERQKRRQRRSTR